MYTDNWIKITSPIQKKDWIMIGKNFQVRLKYVIFPSIEKSTIPEINDKNWTKSMKK